MKQHNGSALTCLNIMQANPIRVHVSLTETPRYKWTGVLIGSSAVAFAFGIIASQFRAFSGRPSVGRHGSREAEN